MPIVVLLLLVCQYAIPAAPPARLTLEESALVDDLRLRNLLVRRYTTPKGEPRVFRFKNLEEAASWGEFEIGAWSRIHVKHSVSLRGIRTFAMAMRSATIVGWSRSTNTPFPALVVRDPEVDEHEYERQEQLAYQKLLDDYLAVAAKNNQLRFNLDIDLEAARAAVLLRVYMASIDAQPLIRAVFQRGLGLEDTRRFLFTDALLPKNLDDGTDASTTLADLLRARRAQLQRVLRNPTFREFSGVDQLEPRPAEINIQVIDLTPLRPVTPALSKSGPTLERATRDDSRDMRVRPR